MTTTILGLFIAVFASFMLYSPQVEKQRVLTIQKPIVITQEKKSPAFYLFQKVSQDSQNNLKQNEKETIAATEYLSTEKAVRKIEAVQMVQQTFDRREIASDQDAGFAWNDNVRIATQVTAPTEAIEPTTAAAVPEQVLETATRVSESLQDPKVSAEKWATIRGKFELRGVGIVPDHKIELKRIEEGQTREAGQIDLRAGLYSIDVSSPGGILVAQIKDKNGIIIGEDRQRMANLLRRGLYFEGPSIQVKNADTVAMAPDTPRQRSGNQKTSRVQQKNTADGLVASLFSGQNQLEHVEDEMQNVSRHSSTIGFLHDVNLKYRSVVTIRQAGDLTKTPLFTEKWADAIVDYVSQMQKIQFNSRTPSIVLGQVLVDGKPAAGVQVAIENKPGVEPIYLDPFLIPSHQLTTTSENGYFMFIALDEGAYTVAAFRQQQIISSNIFISQDSVVSFQTLQASTKPVSVVGRTFNAFTTESVDADVIIPESDEALQTIQGAVRFRKYTTHGISHYTVRAVGDRYVPFHYYQDARKDYVHLPLIEETWLAQAQNIREMNDQAKSGVIVGFVPENDFEAYVINEKYDRNNIIYFDQNGQFVAEPIKGGGFILFGVPLGAVEVVVQDKTNDRVFSQVFAVHDGQVHISHFKDE